MSEHNRPAESAMVGKIVQRFAQTDDIDQALASVYRVEGFDKVALRLMWLQENAEHGSIGLENGALDYHAGAIGKLILEAFPPSPTESSSTQSISNSDHIDTLYLSLHKVGRAIEELKRRYRDEEGFKTIEENQLFGILSELASMKESSIAAGKESMSRFADACSEFIQYVLEAGLLNDVRIINVLDNSNLTLQTVCEASGSEDGDSLESTIELLKRPQDLLN